MGSNGRRLTLCTLVAMQLCWGMLLKQSAGSKTIASLAVSFGAEASELASLPHARVVPSF